MLLAAPLFPRQGVIAGFPLGIQWDTVYDEVEVLVGLDPDTGEPIYETQEVARPARLAAPWIGGGALYFGGEFAGFLDGELTAPDAPLNARNFLRYGSEGLYYAASDDGPEPLLGWVKTNSEGIVAVSRLVISGANEGTGGGSSAAGSTVPRQDSNSFQRVTTSETQPANPARGDVWIDVSDPDNDQPKVWQKVGGVFQWRAF